MKRFIAITLLAALLCSAVACNRNGDEEEQNAGEESPVTGTLVTDPTPGQEGEDDEPNPSFVDPTGGLKRGDDGILIGSAVLSEPILLMGKPRHDPGAFIRVRSGPSLDDDVLTTIPDGHVVEADSIVNGWYYVTLFPEMLNGYIRSDLLVQYDVPGVDINAPGEESGPNVYTGSDPSGLARDANGLLIGSVEFDRPMMLMGMGPNPLVMINVRRGPTIDAALVNTEWGTLTIGKGQMVEAFGVENGWYRVRVHPGMFDGYIRSDLLVPYDERQYFADNVSNFDTRMSAAGGFIAEGPLVDVRSIIPDIEYCIIFATPENFTGKPQYSRDVPLLQYGTALKLKEAQELFKQDGYRIKLYDAYRPSSVSGRLYAIIQDSNYIARAGTSIHNRAAAVDMTLVDADGRELEMPSPMHTFNSTSHRNSSAMSDEARKNMNYMTDIMKQVGMSGLVSSEWWHYGDSESSKYLPMDIEFREFIFSAIG